MILTTCRSTAWAFVVQSDKSLFHGVVVKKATVYILFLLLALAFSLPAIAQDAKSAQRASQKNSQKDAKQQKKQEKKWQKEQKKATKNWNKQHHVG